MINKLEIFKAKKNDQSKITKKKIIALGIFLLHINSEKAIKKVKNLLYWRLQIFLIFFFSLIYFINIIGFSSSSIQNNITVMFETSPNYEDGIWNIYIGCNPELFNFTVNFILTQ